MFVIILKQCILKKSHSLVDERVKKFVPYTGECEYHMDYRSKDKDKPWGVDTKYQTPLIKNHIN